MSVEIKGSWADWKPQPERVGKDGGEIYVKVYLPYSDIQWTNTKKDEADRVAFLKGEILPSHKQDDPDYLDKDDNGNYMPGNITGQIYWDIPRIVPFSRLIYVKQLAFLTHSVEGERNFYVKGIGFTQTRDNHSFLAGIALEKMLAKNNFPQVMINNGIIAAMDHDLATPPYGDPTKEIDPEALNEEAAIKRIFEKYDQSKLVELYGFDEELVLSAIQGQGTLGKLLDIADKLSYTAIDIYNYVGPVSDSIKHFKKRDRSPLSKTIDPIKELIYSNPKWANIYQEVRIDEDGTPYFENPNNLSIFLELRARIHKGLYLNPHCRGQDMLYKMLLKPLYNRELHPDFPFNSENLLYMGDEEADQIIMKSWPFLEKQTHIKFTLGVMPDYVKVKNVSQIDKTIQTLQNRGALVIGSETIRRFNPATKFRVVDPKDGKIKPFAQILPQKAQELNDMVDNCNQTVVYYWPEETDPQSQEVKLKPTIEQIIEDAKRRNNGKLPNYTVRTK